MGLRGRKDFALVKEIINKIDFKSLSLYQEAYVDKESGESTLIEDNDELNLVEELYSLIDIPDIQIKTGMTKCVIIIPNCSIVIKIPLLGVHYYERVWDEEYEEYHDTGYDYYEEYSSANDLQSLSNPNDDYDNDYCWNELQKYELARKKGFSDIFLETCFYGTVDDVPIYLQEKAQTLYEAIHASKSYHSSPESRRILKDTGLVADVDWSAAILDLYGIRFYKELQIFLDKYEMDDDLHNSNIGYCNNKPIILDWSGWRDFI